MPFPPALPVSLIEKRNRSDVRDKGLDFCTVQKSNGAITVAALPVQSRIDLALFPLKTISLLLRNRGRPGRLLQRWRRRLFATFQHLNKVLWVWRSKHGPNQVQHQGNRGFPMGSAVFPIALLCWSGASRPPTLHTLSPLFRSRDQSARLTGLAAILGLTDSGRLCSAFGSSSPLSASKALRAALSYN